MPSTFTVIARMRAQEGREAELRSVLEELTRHTRAEPGCITYQLHVGTDDSRLFTFYEKWSSRDAHAAHNESPHIKRFREIMPDLVEGRPQADALYEI